MNYFAGKSSDNLKKIGVKKGEEYIKQAWEMIGRGSSLQQFMGKHKEEFDSLTDIEVEVLTMMAKEMSNSSGARALGISRESYHHHQVSIQQKLSINHEMDFIKYALAFGLISF